MQQTFTAKRGTNISHWLSQSKRRGAERRAFFRQDDVRRIADWGFDHLRLPIDEEQLWSEDGKKEAGGFDLLDAGLAWAREAGLRVIVDLHILRSHHFLMDQPALFTDPKAPETWADLWRQLSDHLRAHPLDQVAYELMNEPVAKDNADWNRVYPYAFNAIREREPERVIYVGSNKWQITDTFDALRVLDDRHQVLSFHFYNPMLLTHYRASWADVGKYEGPVHYPGVQVRDDDIAGLPEDVKKIVVRSNVPFDRDAMVRQLAKPLAVQQRTGLPLYCGEFGVVKHAPAGPRERWYRDVISVFDQHDIGWSNWDYKGMFGLVDAEGRPTGVAEWLLGR